jgi:hypothetical protein
MLRGLEGQKVLPGSGNIYTVEIQLDPGFTLSLVDNYLIAAIEVKVYRQGIDFKIGDYQTKQMLNASIRTFY